MGQATARLLARHYISLEAWRQAMEAAADRQGEAHADLVDIDGIGPSVAADLLSFFVSSEIIAILFSSSNEYAIPLSSTFNGGRNEGLGVSGGVGIIA